MMGSPPFPAGAVIHLISALENALSPDELLTLVGQVAAYVLHPSPAHRTKLEELAQLTGWITWQEFRELTQAMPRVDDSGVWEAGLVHEQFLRNTSVRYERVDEGRIRELLLALLHAVLVDPVQIAEELVKWWTDVVGSVDPLSPPAEIASLMVDLAATSASEEVYCLGAASEPVVIECLRRKYVPWVVAGRAPRLALLYALITGARMPTFLSEPPTQGALNALSLGGRKPTLAVPPLGTSITDFDARDWIRSEFQLRTAEPLVLECLDRVAPTRAVILVPNGVLSRQGGEQRLRKKLVEQGRVASVISFPAGLLSTTNMPFSLLTLDTPHSAPGILFCEVDAEQHIQTSPGMLKHRRRQFVAGDALLAGMRQAPTPSWVRAVSGDKIAAANYNLNANRYFSEPTSSTPLRKSDARGLLPFGELVTLVKAQAFRPVYNSQGALIHEISPGELPQFDFLRSAPRERLIDPYDLERFKQQQLQADDVLLSTKGMLGRTGIVRPDPDAGALFASQSLVILRLGRRGPITDPVVLLMYLRSPYFQALLRSLRVGSTIPNISLTDLRRLPVAVPTPDQQVALRKAFEAQHELQGSIDTLVRRQQQAENSAWATARLTAGEGKQ